MYQKRFEANNVETGARSSFVVSKSHQSFEISCKLRAHNARAPDQMRFIIWLIGTFILPERHLSCLWIL